MSVGQALSGGPADVGPSRSIGTRMSPLDTSLALVDPVPGFPTPGDAPPSPNPPEVPDDDPLGIPQPGPDVIDPGIGIPTGPGGPAGVPETPGLPGSPGVPGGPGIL